MEKINILGINVGLVKRTEVLNKIQGYLEGKKPKQLITINPEMILEATGHDEEFFYILNRADLALADGVGLKIAGWFLGVNLNRITGADLIKDLLVLAEKQGKKVAIINWRGGLSSAKEIEGALAKRYPSLSLSVIDADREISLPAEQSALLNKFRPEIIICSFGAPFQEKFIFHNLPDLPGARIGLGVGGSFDFLTGKIRRAPKILRAVGLEWLWRLIKQPKRWLRIYHAVIVFPYKFFLWRFILPFRYRKNVACLLYKKNVQGQYEILIVERSDQAGHWQLPQGGTDGENLETAGRRELSEEINNDKFKTVAVFPKVNIYEFGDLMSKFLVSAQKARGYKGQIQGLYIAEYFGRDEDIKMNFWEHRAWRWVKAEKLAETVYGTRRRAAKIFMEKFREIINK